MGSRITNPLPSLGDREKLLAFMNLRQLNFRSLWAVAAISAVGLANPAFTEESADDGEKNVLEGHSYHGEAFNEGPRQSAYRWTRRQTERRKAISPRPRRASRFPRARRLRRPDR